MRRNYSLVHLSDLHLTAEDDGKRSEVALPGQRLTGMNGIFEQILAAPQVQQSDAILITGDVTDLGDEGAWKQFDKVLRKTDVREKTYIVIGNHDVCGMKAFFRPWDKRLLRRLDTKRVNRELTKIGFLYKYPYAEKLAEHIVLFGIDSNNVGNVGPFDNAIGRIGKIQLEALVRLFRKHCDVPIKLVALHHSPNIPERATAIKRRGRAHPEWVRFSHEIPIEDRWSLQVLCVSHGVRLVLHGHLHEYEDRSVNGVRIIGAPSSTQPIITNGKKRYAFNRYKIQETKNGRKYRITTQKVHLAGC